MYGNLQPTVCPKVGVCRLPRGCGIPTGLDLDWGLSTDTRRAGGPVGSFGKLARPIGCPTMGIWALLGDCRKTWKVGMEQLLRDSGGLDSVGFSKTA